MSDLIKEAVEKNYDFLIETRKNFHRHPELSSQEYETAAYIKKHLEEWGIPYETNGVSNIVATIKGVKEDGRTIAIRGDIDALPIQEETGVDFASQTDGVMHACGHDCHATYMLGTAKILNEMKDKLNGTVKVIFQEGEEIGAGARKLVESGLLRDVDNIVGLHTTQEYDLGKISVGYGIMSSYGAGARITVKSKSSCINSPQNGVNALVVAAEIASSITAKASHSFPGNQQVVLVPTMVHSTAEEGKLPDEVKIAYNFRTLNRDNVEILHEIFEHVPDDVAAIFGASVETEQWGPGEALDNDKESTDRAISVIRKYFGDDALLISNGRMGGEDFSLFQKIIPGVYLHVGGAVDGNYRPLHTSKTLVDERVLPIGVEFLLRYIFTYLEEN